MIDEKLTGSSMGERRKAFNSLVSAGTAEELSPENVSKLTTKSQAEQIYMAVLADRFKNSQVVWQILKSGNEMTTKKVLKYKWFFERKTEFMNTEYVFGEIFPNTSYRVRSKIISRLGIFLKDESMAEEFYKKTCDVYGRETAEKILPACSLTFIKDILLTIPDYGIQCQPLIKIYKRDPKLVVEYIDKYYAMNREIFFPLSRKYTSIDYEAFWFILVQDSPEEFIRIYTLYGTKFSVKFGYRNSVSLLKCNLKAIMENKFIRILNTEAILDVVKGENLDKVLMTMMEPKKEDFNYYQIMQFLARMKPKYQLYYIIKMYAAAYKGASFLDTDKFLDMNMAEHLNPEDRIPWAEKKIANVKAADHFKEDYYLKYLPCAKAIPRYTDLCYSVSTVPQRLSLLEKMVLCCKINNDHAALLNLLKYVAKRHRNDAVDLRQSFMNQVYSSFKLHILSAEHWEVINEMLQIMYFNNEIEKNYLQHFLRSILTESLRYRLDNKMEIESVVDVMMKYKLNTLNLLSDNIEYERKIMDVFFERYRILIEGKPFDHVLEANVIILLESYRSWNSKHKGNRQSVTECSWLMEVLNKWMNETTQDKKSRSSIIHTLQEDLDTRKIFADEIFKASSSDKFTDNLFKHDAAVLLNNIDILVQRTVKPYSLHSYVRLFHQIRAYMQKPMGDLLESKIKELESKPERNKDKAAVVMALAFLLDIKDFEKLIDGYMPKKTKIDLSQANISPDDIGEYETTEVICGMLKYVNPPISLNFLSRLAKDDYLKFILPSVLSIPYKKSSNESIQFVKDLAKQPVSVKKHAVRLAYFIYPKECLLDFYKTMWQGEKNSSIRQVIFKWTFKFMLAEPDLAKYKEIWQVLKSFFAVFEEKDKDIFEYLVKIDDIRPEIVDDYCQVSWNTLKMLKAAKLDMSQEFTRFSSNLESVIHLLSDDFCETIIQEYLGSVHDDEDSSSYLLKFSVCCLVKVRSIEAQEKHIASMRKVFEKYIMDNWNVKKDGVFVYRKSLKLFVSECCIQARGRHNINPVNLLVGVGDMLKSILPFEAAFDSNVLIELSIIYKKLLDHPRFVDIIYYTFDDSALAREYASQLGINIIAYMKSLFGKYGPSSSRVFTPCFQEFSDIFFIYSRDDLELFMISFIESILAKEKSVEYLIFAIDLLPSVINTDNINIDRYNAILKIVIDKGDDIVKMILNSKYEMSSVELFGEM